MSATAKVTRDGESVSLKVSVDTLPRCHQLHKSVYPELLSFRCIDRVSSHAQRDVGSGNPLLDVELLGQEHSIDGIVGDINVFDLSNGVTVHPLQPICVSYGK